VVQALVVATQANTARWHKETVMPQFLFAPTVTIKTEVGIVGARVRGSIVTIGECLMKIAFRSLIAVTLFATPTAASWAQDLNPGNSGGGHAPIATPTYGPDQRVNPALTTGSKFSVTADTPPMENPTVSGATGETIVKGDRSSISGDRRATIQQKTGGSASDAPG